MNYVFFQTATGKITKIMSCAPTDVELNVVAGESYIQGEADDTKDYVSGNSILPRQDYTLEALPLPCTITIEGIDYTVTEQPTFEFDAPGVYEVRVDAGAEYLDKVFYVNN